MLVGELVTTGGVVVEETEETPPPPCEVLLLRVLVLVLVGLVEVEGTLGVVTAAPGMHWEYQSFCLTQADPEAQQVEPCQPLPPHWVLHITVLVEQLPLSQA